MDVATNGLQQVAGLCHCFALSLEGLLLALHSIVPQGRGGRQTFFAEIVEVFSIGGADIPVCLKNPWQTGITAPPRPSNGDNVPTQPYGFRRDGLRDSSDRFTHAFPGWFSRDTSSISSVLTSAGLVRW